MSYMKAEFDRILKQYGHNVYLQRRCGNSGNERTDYSLVFELTTCRYRIEGNLLGMEQMEGQLNTSKRVYYFTSETKPWDNDRIWDQDVACPGDGWTVWEIDGIVPMKGVGGQVEYYMTEATRIRPN